MVLLHLTDTHLGLATWFRGGPNGWRRADDHRDAMALALAPALRGEVDAVLHSGDLFDRSRPPPQAIADAARLLGEAARRVPVFVMPGNHDRLGLRETLREVQGVQVYDAPGTATVRGIRLGLVPWQREAAAFASAAAALGGCDLLCAHQGFAGARVPGYVFRPGSPPDTVAGHQLPRGVQWIAGGHLHPRQHFRCGGATVVHPGATERTAFAERHETKGYATWTFAAGVAPQLHDLPSRPMVHLRAEEELDGVEEGVLVWLDRGVRTEAMEAEAIRRGGRVCAWAKPGPQVPLF